MLYCCQPRKYVKKYFYDDYAGMSNYLVGFDWPDRLNNKDVEEIWTDIHNIIATAVDK